MKSGTPIRVRITDGRKGNVTEGHINVQFWNKREALVRAFKFGGMCWAFAVAAVFVPILHFVLVPGLLLAGPLVAFFMSRQRSVVLGGEGICPDCTAALPIARSSYKFPLTDLCTSCQCAVKITEIAN